MGLLTVLILLCSFNNLPDKIDFATKRLELEEINLKYKGKGMTIVKSLYETLYPDRVPLIADSRYSVTCSPSDVDSLEKKYPGYHFVKVDIGWYILYEENVFNPDFP